MNVGGGQAPHLHMASVSGGGADSAEANFANSLLPGGGEDAGGPAATTSGAQGSLDPGILVDNHAPHFTGAAAASPSLFTGLRPLLVPHRVTTLCDSGFSCFSRLPMRWRSQREGQGPLTDSIRVLGRPGSTGQRGLT